MLKALAKNRQLADPNFSSVTLLLHGDGADASTTITDSSSNAFSMTAENSCQIDTAQSKFGGSSIYFPNNNSRIASPSNAKFNLSGDFTVDGFVRFEAENAYNMLLGDYTDNAQWISFTSDTLSIQKSAGSPTGVVFSLSVNVWYHFEISRSGSTVKVFKNGVSQGSVTFSDSMFTNNRVYVGEQTGGGLSVRGWLDEFRITKGVCRHTSDFTVPAEAYPDY